MGYTHYWNQRRAFTQTEWDRIVAESKRICAKAIRGDYYSGKEDFASNSKSEVNEQGFRVGFNESHAWRTFPHEDRAIPMQGAAIKLAGPSGESATQPIFDGDMIALNGAAPEAYESFVLERNPERKSYQKPDGPIFNFCKTEYRAYDAVVVSILHAARTIAPGAITPSSDGGDEAIKPMF